VTFRALLAERRHAGYDEHNWCQPKRHTAQLYDGAPRQRLWLPCEYRDTCVHRDTQVDVWTLKLGRHYALIMSSTLRPATILIVEDDAELRGLYRTSLALEGYTVREARSGFEALSSIDRDPPDLVVLDLGLPGIDGLAVRQELAAGVQSRRIPIVIVTASASVPKNIDVACVLTKPVAAHELLQTVARCLPPSSSAIQGCDVCH
jgi:CheY-like chemotaxis protein